MTRQPSEQLQFFFSGSDLQVVHSTIYKCKILLAELETQQLAPGYTYTHIHTSLQFPFGKEVFQTCLQPQASRRDQERKEVSDFRKSMKK